MKKIDWPFKNMTVGESVEIDLCEYGTTANIASIRAHTYGRFSGKYFITKHSGDSVVVTRVDKEEKEAKRPRRGRLTVAIDNMEIGHSHFEMTMSDKTKERSVRQSVRRLSNKTGKVFSVDKSDRALAITRIK